MTQWKYELQRAFSPPPPIKKRNFLRQAMHLQMNFPTFLYSQLHYIKKWVWLAAASIFAVGILGAAVLSLNMLWVISACSPVLAMTLLSERSRSERYQMEELELSTRFSLCSIILARFAILGLINLLLLLLLLPVALMNNTFSLPSVGLYITTPFLLTVYLGLAITRTHRGQDGLYACWAVSFLVSFFVILSRIQMPFLYLDRHILWWLFALAALCIAIGKHFIAIIHQTEELSWN